MFKRCSICKEIKDYAEFTNRLRAKDGKNARCKICSRIDNKLHYNKNWQKNRDRIDMNHYAKIESLRKQVDDFKMKHGCKYCGYKEHPICLDCHHIDPSTKVRTISSMINCKVKAETLWNEINKCIVVCSNCHRLLHHNLLPTIAAPPI